MINSVTLFVYNRIRFGCNYFPLRNRSQPTVSNTQFPGFGQAQNTSGIGQSGFDRNDSKFRRAVLRCLCCFLIVGQPVRPVRPEKNPFLILSRANRMCRLSNLQKTAKIKHRRTARRKLTSFLSSHSVRCHPCSVPARIPETSV